MPQKFTFRIGQNRHQKKPYRRAGMILSALLILVLFFSPVSSIKTSADLVYYQTRILGNNTWNDENNTRIRPQSISVRLLADGAEVDHLSVSGQTSIWDFDFGEWDTYHSGIPIQYSVVMDPVENYTYSTLSSTQAGRLLYSMISTHQLIVFKHRMRAAGLVGDDRHMLLWGILCLGSAAALGAFAVIRRRRR